MNIICEAYINYKLKGIVTLDELYSFYNNNNFIFKNKKNLIFKKILIMNGYTKFITDDYIALYKELLDIVKSLTKDTNKLNNIKNCVLTQEIWSKAKNNSSIELIQFLDINRGNDIKYNDSGFLFDFDECESTLSFE